MILARRQQFPEERRIADRVDETSGDVAADHRSPVDRLAVVGERTLLAVRDLQHRPGLGRGGELAVEGGGSDRLHREGHRQVLGQQRRRQQHGRREARAPAESRPEALA